MREWAHCCELQYLHHAWPTRLWMADSTRSQTCHPCLGTRAHCSQCTAPMVNDHWSWLILINIGRLFRLNLCILLVTLADMTEKSSTPRVTVFCCHQFLFQPNDLWRIPKLMGLPFVALMCRNAKSSQWIILPRKMYFWSTLQNWKFLLAGAEKCKIEK